MIPQNPMFVIRRKDTGEYMNTRTGASGEGPATIFVNADSIQGFLHFYGDKEFEIVEVELTPKNVVTLDEVRVISKSKRIKKPR